MAHTLVAEPQSSDQLHIRCKRELYRPPSTPETSLRVALVRRSGVSCPDAARDVGRGRETHRHDYTRLPAALGDGLGGLSTSLGLSASPPLILSTESVVVMEVRRLQSIATQYRTDSGQDANFASPRHARWVGRSAVPSRKRPLRVCAGRSLETQRRRVYLQLRFAGLASRRRLRAEPLGSSASPRARKHF